MKPDLEPAKAILKSFLAEIEKVKFIQKIFSEPRMASTFSVHDQEPIFESTEFSQVPNLYWEKENPYMLLYAEPWNFRQLIWQIKTGNSTVK